MTLAIVGLGFMGATHLKAARAIAGLDLAVVSRDAKKRAGDLSSVAGNLSGFESSADFTGIRTFASFEEVLADPGIDAVDLCLPTAMHEPFTIAALRAGKHVLVEKPMAISVDACERMIAEANAAKRVLMVAQVLRFFPAYMGLKHWIASGASGPVRAGFFRRRTAAPGWGPWLRDKQQSGGGVFDLLIHDIDMALYCFGVPDRVSATGYEALEKQVDVISAELFYEGFTVSITGGWYHEGFPFSMEFQVTGEAGTVDYHLREPKPLLYQTGQAVAAVEAGEVDGYQAEIAYFVECARTGQAPAQCSPEDSRRAVALANLLLDSRSQQGKVLECRL
ncbi:MAG: Gfo/Idh/MocA family oxidoreductase [Bryobacter sp.]|nr:Gfo/Idh/MocA family oxidoreductase [Bryobacter sp.]